MELQKELRLDLSKLTATADTPLPFFAVPHSPSEVTPLIDSALDVFWALRRCGESWDSVEPPSHYLRADDDDDASDVERSSRQSYRRLVFDLTGQILCDMYRSEEDLDEYGSTAKTWMRPKPHRNPYCKERQPPTDMDEVKPIVREHILRYVGAGGRTEELRAKWASRKKKDLVDEILIHELREEEPEWVDYDDDELAVKQQLADDIFRSLIADTSAAVADVCKRAAARES